MLDHGWWIMHAKCDNEPAFNDKQWTWLEISWLLHSVFGISHLQQQQNSFHNSAIYSTYVVLYIPHSALFSTLQLYGKYSTLFLFDPPTQNALYIYIYIYIINNYCTYIYIANFMGYFNNFVFQCTYKLLYAYYYTM